MAYQDRQRLIQQLEELRDSKIVTFINSDRRAFPPDLPLPALSTQMSTESQIFLYDKLREIGRTENIDLYLYTRGGETDSVWPLVSLFREFASQQFSVLVPFRAHSAGTMVCLGADKVILGEASELSPIDPTTGNQFNPINDHGSGRKGISVEDVTSYISLATDKVGLEDSDQVLEVFNQLSEQVHPLALGNVNRVHTLIRFLATNLLGLHLESEDESARIEKIVDVLTEKLYSHSHAINRNDARELLGADLTEFASDAEQTLMWQLFEDYAETLQLRNTLTLNSLRNGQQQEQEILINGAFIETANSSTIFQARYNITFSSELPKNVNVQIPPGQPLPIIPGLPVKFNAEVLTIGWQPNEEGT